MEEEFLLVDSKTSMTLLQQEKKQRFDTAITRTTENHYDLPQLQTQSDRH